MAWPILIYKIYVLKIILDNLKKKIDKFLELYVCTLPIRV